MYSVSCLPCSLYGDPQISQYTVFSNHTHYSGHYRGLRITSDKLLKVTYDICVKIKTQRHIEVVLRKTVVGDWLGFLRSRPARNLSLNDLFAWLHFCYIINQFIIRQYHLKVLFTKLFGDIYYYVNWTDINWGLILCVWDSLDNKIHNPK